jgi:hypothetical protein
MLKLLPLTITQEAQGYGRGEGVGQNKKPFPIHCLPAALQDEISEKSPRTIERAIGARCITDDLCYQNCYRTEWNGPILRHTRWHHDLDFAAIKQEVV